MKVEGLPQGSDCTALPGEAARTAYVGPLEVRALGASAQVVMAYPAGAVRLTAAGGTWTPAFLHKDHLGSVRVLSGPDGTPEERTLYRPYGAQSEVVTATLNDDKSWLGERYDAGAGLQYLNARYYDPELAMFLQAGLVRGHAARGGDEQVCLCRTRPHQPPRPRRKRVLG